MMSSCSTGAGVPADKLRREQRAAVPLRLRLRLRPRLQRLTAQDGRPHQGAEGQPVARAGAVAVAHLARSLLHRRFTVYALQ